jgi:hypothetical protein
MGQLLSHNSRLSERIPMNKRRLGGRLLRDGSETEISCKALDVSRHGLGIVSEQQIEVGEVLSLEHKKYRVKLKVVWARVDPSDSNQNRYGLQIENEDIDLVGLCLLGSSMSEFVGYS